MHSNNGGFAMMDPEQKLWGGFPVSQNHQVRWINRSVLYHGGMTTQAMTGCGFGVMGVVLHHALDGGSEYCTVHRNIQGSGVRSLTLLMS